MLKIRRILVATDFSPTANAALDLAAEMARGFGASLLLVHVVPPPGYPNVQAMMTAVYPTLQEQLRRHGTEQMQALVDTLPKDVRAESVVLDGTAHEQIVECAAREKVDMIVIGTHGYSGLKHGLLGSTAERVVRTAAVPVVTIRQPAG